MQKKDVVFLIEILDKKESKTIQNKIKEQFFQSKSNQLIALWERYQRVLKNQPDENIEKFWQDFKKREKGNAALKRELKKAILTNLVLLETQEKGQFEDSLSLNVLAVLFNRKLYDEMRSQLKQLKKQCLEKEKYQSLIEVIKWEMNLLQKQSKKNDAVELQKLIEEQQLYFDWYQQELICESLYKQVLLILEQDVKLAKKDNRKNFEQLCNHSSLYESNLQKYQDQKKIAFWIYRIKSMYHRTKKEYNLSYDYAQKMMRLFDDEMSQKNFSNQYIATLLCFYKSCYHTNRLKEIDNIIEKLDAFSTKDPNLQNRIRGILYEVEVINAIRKSSFKKADSRALTMVKDWQIIEGNENPGKLLYYSYYYTFIYWLRNLPEPFNQWLYISLNITYSQKGKNYYYATRLLALTHHYDQKNFLQLEPAIDAYRKLLDNHKILNNFQKLVIQTLKDLHKEQGQIQPDNQKIQAIFQNLKTELLAFINNPSFTRPSSFYQICVWCQSHLSPHCTLHIHQNFATFFPNY